MYLVFLGLDGVGKSTQLRLLKQDLAKIGRDAVIIHHTTPMLGLSRHVKRAVREPAIRLLKAIGVHRKFSEAQPASTNVNDYHVDKHGSNLMSFIIGHWIVVNSFFKSWSRWIFYCARGKELLGDRCMIDDLVRAEWRIGSGGRLGMFLLRYLPKPDKCIVFRLPVEISYQRKKAMNCDYSEYLAKKACFDCMLEVAKSAGWPISEIDIHNKSVAVVSEEVRRMLLPRASVPQ